MKTMINERLPAEGDADPETLLHFRTILVPTDFSEASRNAIQYAQRLSKQFGSSILLVHVVEPLPPYPVGGLTHFPGDIPPDPNVKVLPDAEKSIRHLGDLVARTTQAPVQTKVLVGRAYEGIVEVAREMRADLVVIATHGYSGIRHFLLGSTAEKVVRHAPCPVLVVRDRESR